MKSIIQATAFIWIRLKRGDSLEKFSSLLEDGLCQKRMAIVVSNNKYMGSSVKPIVTLERALFSIHRNAKSNLIDQMMCANVFLSVELAAFKRSSHAHVDSSAR